MQIIKKVFFSNIKAPYSPAIIFIFHIAQHNTDTIKNETTEIYPATSK